MIIQNQLIINIVDYSIAVLGEMLKQLFEKYLTKITDFKKHNCSELVPIAELNGVVSLTRLFDALATTANGVGKCNAISRAYLCSNIQLHLDKALCAG